MQDLFSKWYSNDLILSELQSVYGSDCVSLRPVEKRRQSYNKWTFSIFDQTPNTRPLITRCNEHISELQQNNSSVKTKEIAHHFNINKNALKSIFQKHLHYHKVNFEWISHQLTASLLVDRVEKAKKLLTFLESTSFIILNFVFTEVETWNSYNNPRTSIWILIWDSLSMIFRQKNSSKQ